MADRRPRRWRYCRNCGFGGGSGRVRSRHHACKNIRCLAYGQMLHLGTIEEADRIRQAWKLRPDPGMFERR